MKAGTALAAALAILAVAAGPASAATRHASPGTTNTTGCGPSAPCELEAAVEGASAGDEVIVAAGQYSPADELEVPSGVLVHGIAEASPPEIVLVTGGTGMSLGEGAIASWLRLRQPAGSAAVFVDGAAADQLFVESGGGGFACRAGGGAFIQDSVCWASATGGIAMGVNASAQGETATLQNVTAVGTAPGSIGIEAEASGAAAGITGWNVIARGTAVDLRVASTLSADARIDLTHSNFATRSLVGPSSFAPEPGLGANQATEPVFQNASAGDFHQVEGESPTIDNGTRDVFFSEGGDIDGEARKQGFFVDIGADELTPGPPPPDTNPPETKILKKPKPRAKSRTARFKFGTTEPAGAVFMCSLDGKAFAPCKSPKRLRVKRGRRHSFAVFSIDEAGNVDPTPDQYSWKVKRTRG